MTNKIDLPTTKTLSSEEMKAVNGGLTFRRRSLRKQPTARSRFSGYGVISMNFTGAMSFRKFGIISMN